MTLSADERWNQTSEPKFRLLEYSEEYSEQSFTLLGEPEDERGRELERADQHEPRNTTVITEQ